MDPEKVTAQVKGGVLTVTMEKAKEWIGKNDADKAADAWNYIKYFYKAKNNSK